MPMLPIRLELGSPPPVPPAGPQPTPNTRLVRTRGYGDPIMVQRMGLDTRLTGDNFNHADFWASEGIKPNGVHSPNWAAVTKWQALGRAEMEYLKSIQPDDFHIWGFTLAQKMNWLVGEGTPPARPYWTLGDKWDGAWESFRFGTMVFGHSRVRVKTNADGSLKVTKFMTEYRDIDPATGVTTWLTGEVEFLEVDGFRPEMMDVDKYPVAWLLENGYIQQATEAYGVNVINDVPRGVMYHPVWSPEVWPSNYGALYLARFCVEEV